MNVVFFCSTRHYRTCVIFVCHFFDVDVSVICYWNVYVFLLFVNNRRGLTLCYWTTFVGIRRICVIRVGNVFPSCMNPSSIYGVVNQYCERLCVSDVSFGLIFFRGRVLNTIPRTMFVVSVDVLKSSYYVPGLPDSKCVDEWWRIFPSFLIFRFHLLKMNGNRFWLEWCFLSVSNGQLRSENTVPFHFTMVHGCVNPTYEMYVSAFRFDIVTCNRKRRMREKWIPGFSVFRLSSSFVMSQSRKFSPHVPPDIAESTSGSGTCDRNGYELVWSNGFWYDLSTTRGRRGRGKLVSLMNVMHVCSWLTSTRGRRTIQFPLQN